MIDLEKVKLWLRVDSEYEDDLIEDMINEAISELALSGVPRKLSEDEIAKPLYNKAIKYIIVRDYEGRGTEAVEDKILDSLVLKLKACVRVDVKI